MTCRQAELPRLFPPDNGDIVYPAISATRISNPHSPKVGITAEAGAGAGVTAVDVVAILRPLPLLTTHTSLVL